MVVLASMYPHLIIAVLFEFEGPELSIRSGERKARILLAFLFRLPALQHPVAIIKKGKGYIALYLPTWAA
eukprot:220575-Pelagomonas_calceolata.AAC.1